MPIAPVPIAVVGALIVAALTTVFAVSASFAGREAPLVPTTSDRTTGESTVFPTVQTPTTTAAAPPAATDTAPAAGSAATQPGVTAEGVPTEPAQTATPQSTQEALAAPLPAAAAPGGTDSVHPGPQAAATDPATDAPATANTTTANTTMIRYEPITGLTE